MPSIYNTTPIDASSPEYERLLLGLQGNILKGHGRCFTANIFLQFHVEGSALKEVLRSLTKRFVTSAHGQLLQRNQYQAQVVRSADSRTVDPLFGNLLLTRNTYKKLHLEECLAQWFPDPHEDPNDQTLPKNSRFRAGMFEAASDLDDRLTASDAVEPLERAYVEGTIDALLLLANDSDSHLIDIADRLIAELASLRIASTVAFEFGRVLRNDRGQGIEHFGYADGISQPLFFRSDFEKLQQVEPVDKWNPFAPLSLALFRDPGVDDENAFGSYYVFRKLEQNVRAFHTAEAELARTLELDSNDTGRAGAMIVGRFRDGTPLVLSQADGMTPVGSNNFRYDGLLATLEPDSSGSGDRLGLKCPFQSHIRKTNPRQSQNATSSTPCDIAELECAHRGRRIVRRGITYGVASGTELPESGVGLLFGCFQRSIMRQYAFMQRSWANTSGFRVLGPSETDKTGLDPVIGQPRNRTKLHHWRKEYGGVFQIEAGKELEKLDDLPLSSSHTTALGLGDFVTFRGGEFFFAPSLPFLLGTDR